MLTEARWNPIFEGQLKIKLCAMAGKHKEHYKNEHWFLMKGKMFLYADTKCTFTFQVQHMTYGLNPPGHVPV